MYIEWLGPRHKLHLMIKRSTGMLLLTWTLTLTIGITDIIFVKANDQEICKVGHMKCEQSQKCIPLSWKCDGDNDCGELDSSDEQNCPPRRCADHEVPCNDGPCIPNRWICDGEPDCPAGEDENITVCRSDNCEEDEFQCGDNACINKNWQCDGTSDCTDGTDEVNCDKNTCEEDMFRCDDGNCISSEWTCDGDNDCLDKSDERGCNMEKECKEDEFKCIDSGRCIDIKWKCDGDFDCPDHSDENVNCTHNPINEPVGCHPTTEFQCKNKECIHNSWKCDGDPDCSDGTDEGDFCDYKCPDDKFQCHNHQCIPASLQCNGIVECMDGSDEWNCSKCQDIGEYDCYGDNSYCIPISKVCDGHNDCDNREDEESAQCRHKDPCEGKECPDHSTCKMALIAYNRLNATCVCNRGFEWHPVEQVCKDIDECQERGVCSQLCINTKGRYKCECLPEYTLEKHYFCRAKGDIPWLYYANKRDIRKIRVDSRYQDIVINSTTNSVALDFDHKEKLMFYTDIGTQVIKSVKIENTEIGTNTANRPTVVISSMEKTAFAADGIGVDWLYKHFYWTDTGSNEIRVATYDGEYFKTLISTGLDEPRAIALDPENGYMYWTDWGIEAKIERCGMDGNHRETLISEDNGLEWPNGLTIDYVDKRIYWIDSKLHKISSANMDGTDYYNVLVDARVIQHPFSISVFEDSLYWSDWQTSSIYSVNKINGHSPTTLATASYSPMGIKVYHEMIQNTDFSDMAMNLCAAAHCEQLCLPAARISSTANQTVVCACSNGFELDVDGKSCQNSSIVSATVKASPSTPPKTSKVVISSTTSKGRYTIISSTPRSANETVLRQLEPEGTGKTFLIVVVSISVVFIVIGVVLLVLCWKSPKLCRGTVQRIV